MSWQEKALRKLPNLEVGNFLWIHGNILINDLGNDEIVGIISDIDFKVRVMQIYSFTWLVNELKKLVDFQPYDSFIWPGRGGKLIRDILDFTDKGIIVPAKRIGYKTPRVEVEPFQAPKDRIAVVDDVVSSGTTAVEIYKQGNLEKADLVTPIMQYPEDSRLKCYERILTAFLVRGPKGKVPVNSLSTFLSNSAVLKSYAERFCSKPDDLITAVELIKTEVSDEI